MLNTRCKRTSSSLLVTIKTLIAACLISYCSYADTTIQTIPEQTAPEQTAPEHTAVKQIKTQPTDGDPDRYKKSSPYYFLDKHVSFYFVSKKTKTLTEQQKKNIVLILSIDGGGIYGIIPGMVLEDIENKTNIKTANLFNVIAGTSTGSILASILTMPDGSDTPKYTAKEATNFYYENGGYIFHRSYWQKITSLWGLAKPKFSSKHISKVFNKVYKDIKLSQLLGNVLIPCGTLPDGYPLWLYSEEARHNDQKDFYMKDSILSSTAIPSMFKPYKLQNINKSWHTYATDAGTFINNPTLQAYLYAKAQYPNHQYIIVSLGTGRPKLPSNLRKNSSFKSQGLLEAIIPAIETARKSSSMQTDIQLRMITKEDKSPLLAYYRFNIQHTENEKNSAFNGTDENMIYITNLGRELIASSKDEMESLISILNSIESAKKIAPNHLKHDAK